MIRPVTMQGFRGCDFMDIDRMCTQNGLTKLANRNVYCCDTDNCNDLVCNNRGECSAPPLTTTTLPLDIGATTYTSVGTTTGSSVESTTKSARKPATFDELLLFLGVFLYYTDLWRGKV